MTLTAINLATFGAVGEAFGQWCRAFTIKDLMALFGVAEQTAKKWRQGKLPEPKHMVAMVELWREDFLLAVFSPALGEDELDLDAELARMERRIGLIRERVTHEAKRGQGLRHAARTLVAGGADDRRTGGAATACGQRSGRAVAEPRTASVAEVGRRFVRVLTVLLALAGAVSVPVADMIDDIDLARTVRTVRVKTGRGGKGMSA